jgi:RNA polymerase sigma-70 factor (ECF subfamily)
MMTPWTQVFAAHQGPQDQSAEAKRHLLVKYGSAVYRYLLGAVRDREEANELFQEFALKFVRGDLRGLEPARGRFRDYLRKVLGHMVAENRRQAARRKRLAAPGDRTGAGTTGPAEIEAETNAAFLEAWRSNLLDAAWEALAAIEQQTGQVLYTVLRVRADMLEAPAKVLAERLSAQLDRPVKAAWVHKKLHLAREKFTELLLDEVTRSLDDPSAEDLERELIDLGLLDRCRKALRRRCRERPA